MERLLRHEGHGNLYYIFLRDHGEHPMPEEKVLRLWQLLKILINRNRS